MDCIDIIFGGQSCEHDISIISAIGLFEIFHKINEYKVFGVYIKKDGTWWRSNKPVSTDELKTLENICLKGDCVYPSRLSATKPVYLTKEKNVKFPDCVIPLVHGNTGEDGKISALLELIGAKSVGCSYESSSLSFDKVRCKQVLQYYNIPMVDWFEVKKEHWVEEKRSINKKINQLFDLPIFVKPAKQGSSIGISRVNQKNQVSSAISKAFEYSDKVLIEKALNVREIEVGVFGRGSNIQCSIPGEIITGAEFYDFEDKYKNGLSQMSIPANLSEYQIKTIRKLAYRVFEGLSGDGYARVDFFVCKDSSRVYFNEINTIPGLTPFSMFTKLWEYSGIKPERLWKKILAI